MIARRFLRDARGATVVVFALTIPLVIGAAAYAVDLSYYNVVRNQLQSAADAAALGATSLVSDEEAAVAMALSLAEQNVPDTFGAVVTAADVTLGRYDPDTKTFVATDVNRNAVAVAASRDNDRGNAAPRYLSAIWGDEGVAIGAYAIAARVGELSYEPPEKTDLDPEAGDYNQIWVYCYDYEDEGEPASRRSQMTLIADNGGTIYEGNYVWPRCEEGESLSFRMRNVRHARSNPALWNNQPPAHAEFSFFTDTAIVDGVEQFALRREIAWVPGTTPWQQYVAGADPDDAHSILETVRCDTFQECDPDDPDNIIPAGTNRAPNVDDQPCEPGKFMYFGWEDRPPGQPGAAGTWTDPAWTDTDFDDIRIVMKCPAEGALGDRIARLVR